jgi:transketolase
MRKDNNNSKLFNFLKKKSLEVRKQTLEIHRIAPQTRVASSLSCVEILVVLFYTKLLNFSKHNFYSQTHDRFIVSKGHGAISLYPILADLGFFDTQELKRVCKKGSFLGAIPDTLIPGFETINGSLGHGLGVACGRALALKRKGLKQKVFVLMGDGELNEGSIWEAIMFSGHHKLDNIILVIDNNKICMLDYCRKVLDLCPLEDKFKVFNWKTVSVNGHDMAKLYAALAKLKNDSDKRPKVILADTKKGKGVSLLEDDSLCHTKSLLAEEVDRSIGALCL